MLYKLFDATLQSTLLCLSTVTLTTPAKIIEPGYVTLPSLAKLQTLPCSVPGDSLIQLSQHHATQLKLPHRRLVTNVKSFHAAATRAQILGH